MLARLFLDGRRWLPFGSALLLYPPLLLLLSDLTELGPAIAALVPAVVAGLAWGFRGGLAAGVLSQPANGLILVFSGHPDTGPAGPDSWIPWAAVLAMGILVGTLRDRWARDREMLKGARRSIIRSSRALEDLHQLCGLVKRCSWCQRVSIEDGRWMDLSLQVVEVDSLSFTHGICPDCQQLAFPELEDEEDDEKDEHQDPQLPLS